MKISIKNNFIKKETMYTDHIDLEDIKEYVGTISDQQKLYGESCGACSCSHCGGGSCGSCGSSCTGGCSYGNSNG